MIHAATNSCGHPEANCGCPTVAVVHRQRRISETCPWCHVAPGFECAGISSGMPAPRAHWMDEAVQPDAELTFAEAMALGEPVVTGVLRPMEVRDGMLYFVDEMGRKERMELVPFKPQYLTAVWRRARSPRKSLVQEMARAGLNITVTQYDPAEEWMKYAIRAVCKVIAEGQASDLFPAGSTSREFAAAIERYFLEPR